MRHGSGPAASWPPATPISACWFAAARSVRICTTAFTSSPSTCRRCANGVEDIAPLATELAYRYAAQFGKELLAIGAEALALLECYSWPGNLRELDNVMRHSVLLSRGEVLLPGHLPASVRESQAAGQPRSVGTGNSLRGLREAAERGLMQRVLADSGHSRSHAAKQLGISRGTLHKKMQQYGLVPA